MNIIEKYSHTGKGYNPYLIGEKWQVAQLNYSSEEAMQSKKKLDIHHLTDESFLLIEGNAVLIAADIKKDQIVYDINLIEPGILYNIHKNVWHNIVLKPGAKVLIVEDANTHLPLPDGDYEFYYFSEKQKKEFKNRVNEVWG